MAKKYIINKKKYKHYGNITSYNNHLSETVYVGKDKNGDLVYIEKNNKEFSLIMDPKRLDTLGKIRIDIFSFRQLIKVGMISSLAIFLSSFIPDVRYEYQITRKFNIQEMSMFRRGPIIPEDLEEEVERIEKLYKDKLPITFDIYNERKNKTRIIYSPESTFASDTGWIGLHIPHKNDILLKDKKVLSHELGHRLDRGFSRHPGIVEGLTSLRDTEVLGARTAYPYEIFCTKVVIDMIGDSKEFQRRSEVGDDDWFENELIKVTGEPERTMSFLEMLDEHKKLLVKKDETEENKKIIQELEDKITPLLLDLYIQSTIDKISHSDRVELALDVSRIYGEFCYQSSEELMSLAFSDLSNKLHSKFISWQDQNSPWKVAIYLEDIDEEESIELTSSSVGLFIDGHGDDYPTYLVPNNKKYEVRKCIHIDGSYAHFDDTKILTREEIVSTYHKVNESQKKDFAENNEVRKSSK